MTSAHRDGVDLFILERGIKVETTHGRVDSADSVPFGGIHGDAPGHDGIAEQREAIMARGALSAGVELLVREGIVSAHDVGKGARRLALVVTGIGAGADPSARARL